MAGVTGDTVVAPEGDRDEAATPVRLDRVLVAIVAVGAFVRFWRLGHQSLWYDEWLTSEATAGSLADVFGHAMNKEGSAPPYFVGMWLWTQAFGRGVLSLRFLPAVAGVATIPVMYAAIRSFGLPRRTAQVAALLVALNPMLVWYSQEARPYSLVVLAAAVSLWGFARQYARPATRDGWAMWATACATAVALHYLAVLLVVAEAVALYVRRPDDRAALRRACLPTAVVVALIVPWALMQRTRVGAPDWVRGWSRSDRLRNTAETFVAGPGAPDDRLWLVGVAAAVLAVVVLVRWASRTERDVAVVLGLVGMSVVAAATVGSLVGADGLLSRYLIAGLVPLVAALGVGLGARRAGAVGLAAVGALCAVSLYTIGSVATEPGLQKPDWGAVADVVDTRRAGESPDDGTRLLLVNRSGYLAQPMLALIDDSRRLMKDDRADDVVEIDVLWAAPSDEPCDFLVGRACSLLFLGRALPEPLAEQVELVERVELDQFVVERYRTRRPLDVHHDDLRQPQDHSGWIYVLP